MLYNSYRCSFGLFCSGFGGDRGGTRTERGIVVGIVAGTLFFLLIFRNEQIESHTFLNVGFFLTTRSTSVQKNIFVISVNLFLQIGHADKLVLQVIAHEEHIQRCPHGITA
jgi:hypothetical protein